MDREIPFKSFAFHISPIEPIILPSYKGSTLRGGFGHAFRKVVCAVKNQECNKCLLSEKCIYSYIFETPPPAGTKIMRKYNSAPHPFIIEPPNGRRQGYTPGSEITFGLTLIGRAIDYLPYFIYAFDELGKMGIGKGRGKYELTTVGSQESNVGSNGDNVIYSSDTKTLKPVEPSSLTLPQKWESGLNFKTKEGAAAPIPYSLTLDFLTPTRIIYDGHLILDIEFHILIRTLLRRLSLLSYFHCGNDPADWDFNGIIEQAKGVTVKTRDLKWYDWERYSARQDTKMKMGGFVGKVSFEGDVEPFMPIIRAGEVLHVGKGTGFGLGRYEVTRNND